MANGINIITRQSKTGNNMSFLVKDDVNSKIADKGIILF